MSQQRRKVRKVVIPIAGFGTRMFPASKLVPKALFPCLNPETNLLTPVILMIIDHAINGLTVPLSEVSIGIIISPSQREMIHSFFFDEIPSIYDQKEGEIKDEVEKFIEISKRVTLIEQPLPNGFGDAIRCAKEFVGDEHFIVMIGDHLFTSPEKTNNCVRQLINCYESTSSNQLFSKYDNFTSITICEESILDTQGVMIGTLLEDRIFAIENIVEKPPVKTARSQFLFKNQQLLKKEYLPLQKLKMSEEENVYLSFFGIELFSPKIFDAVDLAKEKKVFHKGEINMRDSQRLMIHDLKSQTCGVVIEGRRLDVGLPLLYLESVNQFFYQNKK